MINWQAKLVTHEAKLRIAVYFENSAELNARIRQVAGARWSRTLKAWHVPDTAENRKRFNVNDLQSETRNNTNAIKQNLSLSQTQKVDEFRRWLRSKRYSENTIKTYCEALQAFLRFCGNKAVDEITNADIINFNNDFLLRRQLSSSYQNQVVNSIKLFFKKIENTGFDIELVHRPRREKRLPNVLSKAEVKSLLEAHNNIKHKAMLSLVYSCGLRSSELINLKINDIDSARNLLHVKNAKGKKDRICPLSDKTIELLRTYFIDYRPDIYLFEGQVKAEPYDSRSLQMVLKTALSKTKIQKPVTLHWLRHSYATHLLEGGTDLRYIQEILGHKSSRTTEIYTHVSTRSIQKIISPFDDL